MKPKQQKSLYPLESPKAVNSIASLFAINGSVQSIGPLAGGNVNDSYLVATDSPANNKYVLQRLNRHIFKSPDHIVSNLIRITDHITSKTDSAAHVSNREWRMAALIPCANGDLLHKDDTGSTWRMTSYIDGSTTYQQIHSPALARETGYALGTFHFLLFDLKRHQLHNTLPGFHNTPQYLKHYEQVTSVSSQPKPHSDLDFCTRFVADRKAMTDILEKAAKQKAITKAVIHGDPKINNVLFNQVTNQAMGMVDLDTVSPGLIHHDIGDCLRSGCNPAGEETQELNQVEFNLDLARELLKGYWEPTANLLNITDRHLVFEAVRLVSFELGLRFLTDHLKGDVYFKTSYPDQNINRALVQFKLTEDIERKEKEIRKLAEI